MIKPFMSAVWLLLVPVAGYASTTLHFTENQSLAVSASTGNINRLFVKGDKITRHVAPQGTFIFDKKLSEDGSLYFKPVLLTTPFSLFITTKKGHHFSLLVTPVEQNGKTIEMIANNSTALEQHWEKNTAYLRLLQNMMTTLLRGKAGHGITVQAVTNATPFTFSTSTDMQLTCVATSGVVKGLCYTLTNTSGKTHHYSERKFWHHGVRAVALTRHWLKPHHSTHVYMVVSG